jgi:hypothetical protein
MAKAKIKIVSANKTFSKEERDIMRRVMNALANHNPSVIIEIEEKQSSDKVSRLRVS